MVSIKCCCIVESMHRVSLPNAVRRRRRKGFLDELWRISLALITELLLSLHTGKLHIPKAETCWPTATSTGYQPGGCESSCGGFLQVTQCRPGLCYMPYTYMLSTGHRYSGKRAGLCSLTTICTFCYVCLLCWYSEKMCAHFSMLCSCLSFW